MPGAQNLEGTYLFTGILSSLLLALPTNTNKAVQPLSRGWFLALLYSPLSLPYGALLVPSYLPGLNLNVTCQDAPTPPLNRA